MNKLTLFFAFLLGSTMMNAQNVNIPDAAFKAYLVADTMINTNGDAEIQVMEAKVFQGGINIGTVGGNIGNILDLTGIEAFDSITTLNCRGNQLTTLDLSNNIRLYNADCSHNQLTKLNVTGLKLAYLTCNDNLIDSIDVSSSINLIAFRGARNQLAYLMLPHNSTQLNEVNCSMSQLTALDVSNNQNLQVVLCNNNQLTSLNISNTVLHTLDCSENQLTALNLTNHTLLISLLCFSNQLAALDVSSNTNLGSLLCGKNQLTTLNLNVNLKSLNCDTNSLAALDLSAVDSLTFISCAGNSITSLNVSNFPLLTSLSCGMNQLTSLDLSANTALQVLLCQGNQLTSLDISLNTNLIYIFCAFNALTQLNLANGNNTNFTGMVAIFNSGLNCIQVDDSTYSTNNWTLIDAGAFFSTNCFTSITNLNNQLPNITTYPNPTNGNLNINLGQHYNSVFVEVHNIMGQQVFAQDYSQTTQLDLNLEGAAGLYFVNIRTESGVATINVVKE